MSTSKYFDFSVGNKAIDLNPKFINQEMDA